MTDERQGKLSASSAWICYQCPGSMRMQVNMPKEAPAPETIQGTEIAEAMASDDFKGLDDDGRTIAERLQRMIDDALGEWQVTSPSMEPYRIMKEVRLWLYKDGKPLVSAKPDFVAWRPGSALVIEMKSGYLPVMPASQNIQLRVQVICLTAEYPEITEVYGAIAHHRFVGSWTSVYYGPKELEMARKELEFKLWLAEDPDAALVPGEWCRYCRAKTACPAAAAFALLPMTTADKLQPLTVDNIHSVIRKMTLEQMAVVYKNKSIIEKIISAIGEALRQVPSADLAEVGLMRGTPSSGRTITNPGLAQQILLDNKLATQQEFEGFVNVVNGRVEDVVVDRIAATTGTTKKEAKKILWNMLAPATTPYTHAAPLKLLKEKND